MEEEQIFIKNGHLVIEGLLKRSSAKYGVVICHPHSLMGGSMHNNVVEAIQEAFSLENHSTLRFNFRGVGLSGGAYDEGRGEQEDIFASVKYLKDAGVEKICFAGYSFGAWVGSKVLERADNPFAAGVFFSPPVNHFEFNFSCLSDKIQLVVLGDRDPFCNLDLLKREIVKVNADLEVIAGADHFYRYKEKKIVEILRKKMTILVNNYFT